MAETEICRSLLLSFSLNYMFALSFICDSDELGELRVPVGSLGKQLIGREDLIKSTVELLAKADPKPEERRVMLFGVPGVGKVRPASRDIAIRLNLQWVVIEHNI